MRYDTEVEGQRTSAPTYRIPPMTAKLTPAQARTFAQIVEAQPNTPDKVLCGAWFQVENWVGPVSGRCWNGNRVYGSFNTATLKCLEAKGLIKVHQFGIEWRIDEIEVLTA